jgi:hypothetical protein
MTDTLCDLVVAKYRGIGIEIHGVASRDRIYAFPPRPPRLPPPRPRSLAITSKYTEFLPTRRSLPSSLAGAVLVSVSVGSCGVKVILDVSREMVFEGAVGTGASRGFSGVR